MYSGQLSKTAWKQGGNRYLTWCLLRTTLRAVTWGWVCNHVQLQKSYVVMTFCWSHMHWWHFAELQLNEMPQAKSCPLVLFLSTLVAAVGKESKGAVEPVDFRQLDRPSLNWVWEQKTVCWAFLELPPSTAVRKRRLWKCMVCVTMLTTKEVKKLWELNISDKNHFPRHSGLSSKQEETLALF